MAYPADAISAEDFNKMQDAAMSERALLDQVLRVLKVSDWYVHHVFEQHNRARRTDKGYPDINATKGGRIIYAELKREKGKLTLDQVSWLNRLALNRIVEVYVVRPSTRQEFYDCLLWEGRPQLFKVKHIAWKGGEL